MQGETALRAMVGTQVEVELVDEGGGAERMVFELVAENAADFDRGLLGINTPLAKAIRGKAEGSVVAYAMGDIRSVRIVGVRPSEVDAAPDAAERRQATLDEARRKAERTNADLFAASYSGKWGDYRTDEMAE